MDAFRRVQHVAFAVPGDLSTPTGGYRYDQRIIQELRLLGWQVDVLDIGDSFPFPSAAQRATALVMLSTVPAGCPIVLDGLAFGTLPEAGALRSRTPLIALVHQPLALDCGLDTEKAAGSRQRARRAGRGRARRRHQRGDRPDCHRRLQRPVSPHQRRAAR